MPWSETSTVDQKRLFVADYQRDSFAMAELCRRYGVSRPTGYKWIQRFEGEGFPGLTERSKPPKGCSHETAIEITEAIPDLRRRHPYWGAKKLLTLLELRHPQVEWPARWTVRSGHILYRSPGTSFTPEGCPGWKPTPRSSVSSSIATT